MPAATADGPTVSLSFANNFWGKDDAGVGPMLERMHAAKQTCDELRSFYGARAAIEDEYSRKLMSLCRKSLGSQEMGTLKHSLDTVRGEVESIAKQHQSIAAQMKTELEEPLAAFAGGMKERRKIVQNTVEKLLKTKVQQTQQVNKTRDRYEQECLKIKGYLAQGHMVMGQEERKNKAKLEKTQISLATSNTEYENAVKALEDTTSRWNREWKNAADKFQDLEEERLDFTKSSLWTFANIASTVCVSDDASCEKIRLSLEKMEVEKDIVTFIQERGTGQEIPDPPKYINFCRGDVDSQSEASLEDDNYSVAQFPRSINPAYRSSSPQPSTFESHHDPDSALARDLIHSEPQAGSRSREVAVTPQKVPLPLSVPAPLMAPAPAPVPAPAPAPAPVAVPAPLQAPAPDSQRSRNVISRGYQKPRANTIDYDPGQFSPVPHDPYPMDGMTMLCRPTASDLSTATSGSSARPSSRDSHSETSLSSHEPPREPPTPQVTSPPARMDMAEHQERKVLKKKSGFFQNHSPFGRKKSTREVTSSNRNTWHPSQNNANSSSTGQNNGSSGYGHTRNQSRPPLFNRDRQPLIADRAISPDPIEANASLALNVGQNVFPVEHKSSSQQPSPQPEPDDDPIALALAELKGVTSGAKQASERMSADRYHGIATPGPSQVQSSHQFSRSVPSLGTSSAAATPTRAAPPPSYDQPVQRLGVPPPAVTSKAMKESSQKFHQQTRSMFHERPGSGAYASGAPATRPATRGHDVPRAASPAPPRSASPRPGSRADPYFGHRSASPNPYSGSQGQSQAPPQTQRGPSAQAAPKRGSDQGFYRQNSPNDFARPGSSMTNRTPDYARPGSSMGNRASEYARPGSSMGNRGPEHARPGSSMGNRAPEYSRPGSSMGNRGSDYARPGSSMGDMGQPEDAYGSQRGRGGRPGTSQGNRAMTFYEGSGAVQPAGRQRSKSVADPSRQFTRDGRPIMHFARAMYMYQAAIPEELGFGKGDTLAVLRHQDDGWWEATVQGGNGQIGLVPSNYLQPI